MKPLLEVCLLFHGLVSFLGLELGSGLGVGLELGSGLGVDRGVELGRGFGLGFYVGVGLGQ